NEAKETFAWRKHFITDLRGLFAKAWQDVASREGVAHACDIQVGEDFPVFTSDQEYLKCALTQLMDNAVKFSPKAEKIQVGAEMTDEAVRLWVRDTGRGIPLE